MSKKLKLASLAVIVTLTVLSLIKTNDLEQINKESIFLTNEGLKSYRNFEESFNEKNILIGKVNITLLPKSLFFEKVKVLEDFCLTLQFDKEEDEDFETCSIIYSDNVPESFKNLFKIESEKHQGFIITSRRDRKISRDIIRKVLSLFPDKQVSLLGVSYTNFLLDQYSKDIKEKLFPFLFLIVFTLTLYLTKNVKNALFLFFPSLVSASQSLLYTKLIYGSTNLVVAIVPLMMFVTTLSLSLHLFFTLHEEKSFIDVLKKKFQPILLMAFTTFIGFLSLRFSTLNVISDFGTTTSILILTTTLSTLLWFFCCSEFLSPLKKSYKYNFKVLSISQNRALATIIFSIAVGLFTFSKIGILTDATKYFPEDTGLRKSMIEVSRGVVGIPSLDIVIDFEKTITIDELKKIETLEKVIEQNGHSYISANKLTSLANLSYSKSNNIPDYLLSYQTLYSKLPNTLSESYPLENKYRISVLSEPLSNTDYSLLVKKIVNLFKNKSHSYSFNGLYYQLMVAQKEMINTLLWSFLSSLLVISIIAAIFFKKPSILVLLLGVNISPILLSFPIIKGLGVTFNIATVMTYSISLGLVVDGTFHIIHCLLHHKESDYYYQATTVRPVLFSSIILIISFLSFSFIGFIPIKHFGVNLSVILSCGLFYDLWILPSFYKSHQI